MDGLVVLGLVGGTVGDCGAEISAAALIGELVPFHALGRLVWDDGASTGAFAETKTVSDGDSYTSCGEMGEAEIKFAADKAEKAGQNWFPFSENWFPCAWSKRNCCPFSFPCRQDVE